MTGTGSQAPGFIRGAKDKSGFAALGITVLVTLKVMIHTRLFIKFVSAASS